MNRRLYIVSLLFFILAGGSAQAFNNQRQAFIAGLGIGYHGMQLDKDAAGNGTTTNTVDGLASSVRIGVGLSNQFTLYYLSEGNWYNSGGSSWFSGINGLGAAYYFSPRARSLYLHYGYGYSYTSHPWETTDKTNNSKFGNGYILGAGYEFMPHVSVEASYMRTNLTDVTSDSLFPSRTTSWRLMLNYLFY